MNWLKENWFKSSIVLVLLILVLSIIFNEEALPVDELSNQEYTKTQAIVNNSVADIKTTTQDSATEAKTATEITATKLYPVAKVVDGDTLAIQIDGQSQTIRLIGIDTPETVHPSKPVECFGVEASNRAKAVLTGAQVGIEKDPTQGDYDKYNRLLAYVILEDGTNFNKLMIEEGYAYEYTYNSSYKYQNEFKLAQQQAQTDKRGLWADGACEEEVVSESIIIEEAQPTNQNTGNYNCSANVYNCTDFSTHDEAQNVFMICGGINNDIHRLDRDGDGNACESLP